MQKGYTIEFESQELCDRFEKMLKAIQHCCVIGHSAGVEFCIDGDGDDRMIVSEVPIDKSFETEFETVMDNEFYAGYTSIATDGQMTIYNSCENMQCGED
jgi:hypothetical protein